MKKLLLAITAAALFSAAVPVAVASYNYGHYRYGDYSRTSGAHPYYEYSARLNYGNGRYYGYNNGYDSNYDYGYTLKSALFHSQSASHDAEWKVTSRDNDKREVRRSLTDLQLKHNAMYIYYDKNLMSSFTLYRSR